MAVTETYTPYTPVGNQSQGGLLKVSTYVALDGSAAYVTGGWLFDYYDFAECEMDPTGSDITPLYIIAEPANAAAAAANYNGFWAGTQSTAGDRKILLYSNDTLLEVANAVNINSFAYLVHVYYTT